VAAIELTKAYLRATAGRTAVPVTPVPITVQAAAGPAPISTQIAGGEARLKVLVPVDRSRNCQFAVKHVIREFMNRPPMEIHLLNVQPPFSKYIARFVTRKALRDHHREQADKALHPIRQM